MPNEAGYRELRELFEYLAKEGVIEHKALSTSQGGKEETKHRGVKPYEVCVIDADDLLDHPKEVVEKFCEMVGLEFHENMLEWGANEGCESFDKWKGFHEDAIGSSGLRPRTTKKIRTREEEKEEWIEKYGLEGAEIIEKTADDNLEDYEFLRQFRITI
ncbi:hypothetical protein ABW20_dc0105416 [Dactylellina cionopaga]|nr:hypothetical protein ABW20_dc0105416 [Dactylellina cionopaga]